MTDDMHNNWAGSLKKSSTWGRAPVSRTGCHVYCRVGPGPRRPGRCRRGFSWPAARRREDHSLPARPIYHSATCAEPAVTVSRRTEGLTRFCLALAAVQHT